MGIQGVSVKRASGRVAGIVVCAKRKRKSGTTSTTCPAAFALMLGESAVTSCGHPFSGGLSGYVPILLQKLFSTVIKFFSRQLMRFSDKYVRDLVS
jgi:hypothetical protein